MEKIENIKSDTIIIDNGSFETKIGYAGNMNPDIVIPTVIGKNIGSEKKYFIGEDALNKLKEKKLFRRNFHTKWKL